MIGRLRFDPEAVLESCRTLRPGRRLRAGSDADVTDVPDVTAVTAMTAVTLRVGTSSYAPSRD